MKLETMRGRERDSETESEVCLCAIVVFGRKFGLYR